MVPVALPKTKLPVSVVEASVVPVSEALVPKTAEPVPVSSVSAVRRLEEVKEPREVALPTEVTAPVRLALVVTVAALPPMERPEAVPVSPVPAPEKEEAVTVEAALSAPPTLSTEEMVVEPVTARAVVVAPPEETVNPLTTVSAPF